MESLGKDLKAERELRNLSLEQAANFTKIREPLLRAIEDDRYEVLPPSFYVKGFLVAYARYLGLDPNEVILRYQKEYPEEIGVSKQKHIRLPRLIPPPKKNIRIWLFSAFLFAMILLILFFIYYIPLLPGLVSSTPGGERISACFFILQRSGALVEGARRS